MVAYLNFEIRADASLGQTILTNSPGASDPSGNDISIAGTNGIITVMTLIYVSMDGTCGGNSPCYSRIQDAVDSDYELATVKVEQGMYHEEIILDENKRTILEGGWDSTFTSQPSFTTTKSMTFTGGALEAEHIILQ